MSRNIVDELYNDKLICVEINSCRNCPMKDLLEYTKKWFCSRHNLVICDAGKINDCDFLKPEFCRVLAIIEERFNKKGGD